MAVSFLLLFLPLHVWTVFLQTISQDNPLLSEVAVPLIAVIKTASNTVFLGLKRLVLTFHPLPQSRTGAELWRGLGASEREVFNIYRFA